MNNLSKSDNAAVTQAVNALLLRTFALLQTAPLCSATLFLALDAADRALAIASRFCRFDLEPRAHLHRGHVLRAWGRWRAAHAAYVRAASVRGIGYEGTDIRGLTRECLEMIRAEDEWKALKEKAREKRRGEKKKRGGGRRVRFGDDEEPVMTRAVGVHDDYDGTRSDESPGEMYLLLNDSGEVVGSRESLPGLRSVRGRSVHRSTTSLGESSRMGG